MTRQAIGSVTLVDITDGPRSTTGYLYITVTEGATAPNKPTAPTYNFNTETWGALGDWTPDIPTLAAGSEYYTVSFNVVETTVGGDGSGTVTLGTVTAYTNFAGLVEFSNLTDGTTQISGGNILTGQIAAEYIDVGSISVGDLSDGSNYLTSVSWTEVTSKPSDSSFSALALASMANGGISDIVFTKDTDHGGTVNVGEIRVQGSTFYHPDGTKYTLQADSRVLTNYGEGDSANPFFILFSASNVYTRFGWSTYDGVSNNFFPAEYDYETGEWYAHNNTGTSSTSFTPLATDCIVAYGKAATTGGIESLNSIMSVNTNLPEDNATVGANWNTNLTNTPTNFVYEDYLESGNLLDEDVRQLTIPYPVEMSSAIEYTINVPSSTKALLVMQIQDAEGIQVPNGVQWALNDVYQSQLDGPDNATVDYKFEVNLQAGNNSVKIWSNAGDGGTVYFVKAYSLSKSGGEWFKLTGRSDTAAPTDYDFVQAFDRLPLNRDVLLVEDTNGATANYQYDGTSWSEITALIKGNMLVDGTVTADQVNTESLITSTIIAREQDLEPTNGLVHYFPLNEVKYSSGSSYYFVEDTVGEGTGRIHGSTASSAEIRVDSPKGGAYLNAANRGVELLTDAQADTLQDNQFSCSLWVKSTSTSGLTSARMITRDASEHWALICNQSTNYPQNLQLLLDADNHYNQSVLLEGWNHLAFTYDGTTFSLYVNTKLVYSTENFTPTTQNTSVFLGSNVEAAGYAPYDFFEGLITEVRFYNRILTSSEVSILGSIGGIYLNGDLLVDGSITTDQLAANSVTAAEINVSQLSAISGDLGTLTAGNIDASQVNITNLQVGSLPDSVAFDADVSKARDIALDNGTNDNLVRVGTFTSDGYKGSWEGTIVNLSNEPGSPTLEQYSHALKLSARDSYEDRYIPVTPGETLYFSGWFNTENTTQQVRFGYRAVNSGVAQLLWPTVVMLEGGNGWKWCSGSLVIPNTGTTAIIPFLQINAFSEFGATYVNELRISRTAPVSPKSLQDLDSAANTKLVGIQSGATKTGGEWFRIGNLSATEWPEATNSTFNTVFQTRTGRAPLYGDVALAVRDTGESKTFQYNGAWNEPAAVIRGDMLVKGTVTADRIDVIGSEATIKLDGNETTPLVIENITDGTYFKVATDGRIQASAGIFADGGVSFSKIRTADFEQYITERLGEVGTFTAGIDTGNITDTVNLAVTTDTVCIITTALATDVTHNIEFRLEDSWAHSLVDITETVANGGPTGDLTIQYVIEGSTDNSTWSSVDSGSVLADSVVIEGNTANGGTTTQTEPYTAGTYEWVVDWTEEDSFGGGGYIVTVFVKWNGTTVYQTGGFSSGSYTSSPLYNLTEVTVGEVTYERGTFSSQTGDSTSGYRYYGVTRIGQSEITNGLETYTLSLIRSLSLASGSNYAYYRAKLTGFDNTDTFNGTTPTNGGSGAIAFDGQPTLRIYSPGSSSIFSASDISVTTGAASGGGSLSYNNQGDFTFAPADLSSYATETYVDTAVSNLVDSSPDALNTLNELAAALGDDANFSTTVTNSLATKAPLASPTFTGDVTLTTIDFQSPNGSNTITATMLDSDVLSFSGDSGQLFSISDSMTGTIFSVNDISGIPSIEVDDDGTIRLAEYAGNVLIGTNVDDGTSALQVDGTIKTTTLDGSLAWSKVTSTPTTLAGYGITDAFDGAFSSLTSKPTTLAGYGITDAFDGAFSSLTSTPTTLAGYGITDAFDGAYSSLTGAPTNVSSFTNDAGYLTSIPSAYLTETEGDARYQRSAGIHNRLTLNLGNIGTAGAWYKLGTFTNNNGFVQIQGTIGSHVEDFGTCKLDLTVFAREGNSNIEISVDGTITVADSISGILIYKATDTGTYHSYDIWIRVPNYAQVCLDINSIGSGVTVFVYDGSTNQTTQPTGIEDEFYSGGLGEGHYNVTASVAYRAYNDDYHPTADYATTAGSVEFLQYGTAGTAYGDIIHRLTGNNDIQQQFRLEGYENKDHTWDWKYKNLSDTTPTSQDVMVLRTTGSRTANLELTGEMRPDSLNFGTHGTVGSRWDWVNSNAGTEGGVWKKACTVTAGDGLYSGCVLDIEVERPRTNYGSSLDGFKHTGKIIIQRSLGTQDDTVTATVRLRGGEQYVRVYKTANNTYEIQVRPNADHQAISVKFFISSSSQCTFARHNNETDGTTTGGTAYTATESSNAKYLWPGTVGAPTIEANSVIANNQVIIRPDTVNQDYSGTLRLAETNYQGGFVRYDGDNNVLRFGTHDTNNTLTTSDIDSFYLTRSNGYVYFQKPVTFTTHTYYGDSDTSYWGDDSDFSIFHNGTSTILHNDTGSLKIEQDADDGDIQFHADNGSGGLETYYTIDGSARRNTFLNNVLVNSNEHLSLSVSASDLTANRDFYASHINFDLSGSDALTTDRNKVGLFIDVDSIATGGDGTNEHRLFGLYSDVRADGDSDLVKGGYFYARSDISSGNCQAVYGIEAIAYDNGSGTSDIGAVYGGRFAAYASNSGNTSTPSLYGTQSIAVANSDVGSGQTISQMTASYCAVTLENQTTAGATIPNLYGIRSVVDNNAGTSLTLTNSYLFHGDYQGTLPTNANGIVINDDVPNTFGGRVTAKEFVTAFGGSITSYSNITTTNGYIKTSDSGSAGGYYVGANKIITESRALQNITSATVSGYVESQYYTGYNGQELILAAGESRAMLDGVTGGNPLQDELVYAVAEGGLQVISSPGNWSTDGGSTYYTDAAWAQRHTARICDSSGNSSLPKQLIVNGGNNNSGKADLSVGCGGDPQISLYADSVNMGSTDMNWISKFYYDGATHMAAWDNNIDFFIQGGTDRQDIIFRPYNGTSTTEVMRIQGNSVVNINGLLTATTKSFTIDHPTKEGYKLRYGSLEGPENGVYVRGRLKGTNTIELPEYWKELVHEDSITVNLTPIGKGQDIWVEDFNVTEIVVGGENVNCFYTVYGERKDVDKLITEFKEVE